MHHNTREGAHRARVRNLGFVRRGFKAALSRSRFSLPRLPYEARPSTISRISRLPRLLSACHCSVTAVAWHTLYTVSLGTAAWIRVNASVRSQGRLRPESFANDPVAIAACTEAYLQRQLWECMRFVGRPISFLALQYSQDLAHARVAAVSREPLEQRFPT